MKHSVEGEMHSLDLLKGCVLVLMAHPTPIHVPWLDLGGVGVETHLAHGDCTWVGKIYKLI